MQKIFKDKTKLFECNIYVDGTKLSETKARLILEFPNNRNLLFHGDIDKTGKCEITIPALKEMEECSGRAVLEVIAESSYFETWSDDFELETSKKVRVEMVDKSDKKVLEEEIKKAPRVEIITESAPETPINENLNKFKTYVKENNVPILSVVKDKEKVLNILFEYKKKHNLTKETIVEIANEINRLKKSEKINKFFL
jgi:hypothetical protein